MTPEEYMSASLDEATFTTLALLCLTAMMLMGIGTVLAFLSGAPRYIRGMLLVSCIGAASGGGVCAVLAARADAKIWVYRYGTPR
jgi:hypothetical protein